MESSHSLEVPLVFDCSRIVLPAFSIPRSVSSRSRESRLLRIGRGEALASLLEYLGSDLEELQSAQTSLYSWEHILRTYRPVEIKSEPAPSLPKVSICELEFTPDEFESI